MFIPSCMILITFFPFFKGFCTKHKPCQNKASCTSTGNGIYNCSCPVDFTGKNCSIKIVPCKSNPCLNNGICNDVYGRGPPMFQCKCLYEYYGRRCELEKGKNKTFFVIW